MIDERTIFIIGAGASVPYGFPAGKDLSKSIIEILSDPLSTSGGTHIVENTDLESEELVRASKDFRNWGTDTTIDKFLG